MVPNGVVLVVVIAVKGREQEQESIIHWIREAVAKYNSDYVFLLKTWEYQIQEVQTTI